MLFFDGFRAATGCIKSIVCCLCCLLIGGPILVIVGAVLLSAKNTREDDVKAYNTAVTDYAANASKVNAWTGTINAASVSVISVTDPILGSTDGITTTGVSRVTVAYNVPIAANYQFTLGTVDPFIVNGISDSRTASTTLRCSSSNGCTTSWMSSQCRSTYGSSATYSGYGCSGSGSCGTCSYPAYLDEACVVVGRNSNGATMGTYEFSRDTSKQSCFYPFTISSNKYSTSKSSGSSFKMTARKYDDPYLVLERVSEGTMDFGITKEQQATIGVILLVIGIVLTVIVCASCVLVYMCCLRALTNSTTNQVGVMPVTTTTVVYTQQPVQMMPMQPTPMAGGPVYGQPMYNNGGGYSPVNNPPPPGAPIGGYGQPPQPAPIGGYGYAQPAPAPSGYGQPAPNQQMQYAAGVPPQGPGAYLPNDNNNNYNQPQYATGAPPQGPGYEYSNYTNGQPQPQQQAGYGNGKEF